MKIWEIKSCESLAGTDDFVVKAEANVYTVGRVMLKSLYYKGYPYVIAQWNTADSYIYRTVVFDVLHGVFDTEDVQNDPNMLINHFIDSNMILLNQSEDVNGNFPYFYSSDDVLKAGRSSDFDIALHCIEQYHEMLMRGVLVSNDTIEGGDPDA